MKRAVFSGTFDPPTTGHTQIIETCLKIFDCVTVAVMVNPQKTPLLSAEDRVRLLKKIYANDGRVKVISWQGTAVELLKSENTPFYVRGVRNTIDFEYENMNFFASRKLSEDIVTVYIPAEQENVHISSSLVRNSVAFKSRYLQYIPAPIQDDIIKLLEKN